MSSELKRYEIKEAKRVLAVLLLRLDNDCITDTEASILYELMNDPDIRKILGG